MDLYGDIQNSDSASIKRYWYIKSYECVLLALKSHKQYQRSYSQHANDRWSTFQSEIVWKWTKL